MTSTKQYMISTKDNPFNYFTEFNEWLAWDTREGYNTLRLLASVTRTSHELPEPLQDAAIDDAMDEIMNEILPGIYEKVEQPADYVPQTVTSSA